jgi:hypothetical protein
MCGLQPTHLITILAIAFWSLPRRQQFLDSHGTKMIF